MLSLLLSTIGLGLVFSATPGAVNAEALRRGLAAGFWPALLVQLGSLIGDVLWAALALTGAAFLVQHDAVRLLLGLAGGCFLLRLAWRAIRDAWVGAVPAAGQTATRGDFLAGLGFSLTNPFAVAFWLGIGGGMLATAGSHPHLATVGAFLAGFVLGAALWCVGSAALIAWGRRFTGSAVYRWINGICGAVLGYFGARLLWRSAQAARLLRIVIG